MSRQQATESVDENDALYAEPLLQFTLIVAAELGDKVTSSW
jgi:hypothetical protein